MTGRAKTVGQVVAIAAVAGLLGAARLEARVRRRRRGRRRAREGRAPASRRRSRSAASTPRAASSRSPTCKGKPVVVNFWASWCIPCKDEAPALQETYEQYRTQGLVVLGVDAQDFRQDARRFVKRFGVTYPIVYDGSGSTLGKWGVTGFPETFFVDRQGRLVGERIQGGIDTERNREALRRGRRGSRSPTRSDRGSSRPSCAALALVGAGRGGRAAACRPISRRRSSARPARRRSTSRTRRSRRG